jgi:predicted glycoside hydrolase/deacetylase ChbG (UPF0249 family)
MKKIFFIIFLVSSALFLRSQPTLQEKLGYPKEAKLLIIHGDDIGVSHSQNAATIAALEKGPVNSGSIMVPCPWFPEIAAYAKAHPGLDLGLHLTLTAEWKYYKWRPVLNDQVKSLVTADGFLTDGSVGLRTTAKIDEVEKELRAQINRAIQFGIDPTHLDSHMGMLFQSADLANTYVKLGREFKIPVLLNKEIINAFKIQTTAMDVVLDKVITAQSPDFKGGMKNYYTNVLNALGPGVNCLLIHLAYDDEEMKAVTIDHPDWGAAWRQADFDFFTSEECRKMLKDQKIQLITWKEIRDKLLRK